MTSIEKKFLRRAAGYILFGHKRNEDALEGLKLEPVDKKVRRYKSDWQGLVTRINNNRLPKIMLNYRPNGRRLIGRSLKKLLYEVEKVYQGLTHGG